MHPPPTVHTTPGSLQACPSRCCCTQQAAGPTVVSGCGQCRQSRTQSRAPAPMRLQTQGMHSVQVRRRENAPPAPPSFHCVLSLRAQHSQKNLHMVQQLLGGFGVRYMCNSTPAPSRPTQPQHKHNCSRMPGPADWKKPKCHADPSNSVALFTTQGIGPQHSWRHRGWIQRCPLPHKQG